MLEKRFSSILLFRKFGDYIEASKNITKMFALKRRRLFGIRLLGYAKHL